MRYSTPTSIAGTYANVAHKIEMTVLSSIHGRIGAVEVNDVGQYPRLFVKEY